MIFTVRDLDNRQHSLGLYTARERDMFITRERKLRGRIYVIKMDGWWWGDSFIAAGILLTQKSSWKRHTNKQYRNWNWCTLLLVGGSLFKINKLLKFN